MASRSWNRVELIGNLTRDPELRFIPSGTAVCTFGIATNRTYVSEGEKKEEVDFHRIVAWGKLGELCNQLLKKGSRVFISGRLQYREWEPQEGGKRRDAEIVLEDMILITPKNGSSYTGEEMVEEAPADIPEEVASEVKAEEKEIKEEPEKVEDDKESAEDKKDSKAGSSKTGDETVSEDDLPF